MADTHRETVVVEGNHESSHGWLIALGVIVLLLILFFSFGGASLFGGGSETVNVDTPNTVNVQPVAGQ